MNFIPFAILLVFKNEKESAEKLLTDIYSLLRLPFSVYIIDDASTDQTPHTIQSVISHFDHENTFFFENTTSVGREASLSQLYTEVNSDLIWAPSDNQRALEELRYFISLAEVLASPPPNIAEFPASDETDSEEVVSRWITAFVDDEDPEVQKEDSSEADSGEPMTTDTPLEASEEPFFEEAPMTKSGSVAGTESPQFTPREEDRSKQDTKKVFKKSATLPLDNDASDFAKEIREKLIPLIGEGEYLVALKTIDAAIEATPSDTGLIQMKIALLMLMSRFVEASELKHRLKTGNLSGDGPKVRRESILLVDTFLEDNNSDIPFEETPIPQIPRPALPNETVDAKAPEADAVTDSIPAPVGEPPSTEVSVPEETVAEHDVPAELGNETESESESVTASEIDETEDAVSVQPDQEGDDIAVETESPESESDLVSGELAETEKAEDMKLAGNGTPQPKMKIIREYSKNKPRITFGIPTTADGRVLLEQCLGSVTAFSKNHEVEFVIVNNASLDDTADFLKTFADESEAPVKIITNLQNSGFAKSVNQILDEARAEYILILHNDVVFDSDVPGRLADLMDANPKVWLMGPTASFSQFEGQASQAYVPESDNLVEVDFLDSFCMMIRRDASTRFDESLSPAWFEDVDFCLKVMKKGGVVAIAEGVHVQHTGGATTLALGLDPYSKTYWRNLTLFQQKWQMVPQLPIIDASTDPIDVLTWLGDNINHYFPEDHLRDFAYGYLSSEIRTMLVKSDPDRASLFAIIRLLIVIDQRDLLRQVEEKLNRHVPDMQLLYYLIEYYYSKHVYSRCQKYLNMIEVEAGRFRYRMLELKMLIGNKQIREANELIAELTSQIPIHPELFKISGDMHRIHGNSAEAGEFYNLAHVVDPYRFEKKR